MKYTGNRPICLRGHDKRITGVYRRRCRVCIKEDEQTPKRKAYRRKYEQTPKRKAYVKKRMQTLKYKASKRRYRQTPPAKALMKRAYYRYYAKHREQILEKSNKYNQRMRQLYGNRNTAFWHRQMQNGGPN